MKHTNTRLDGSIDYYEPDINPLFHTFESCYNRALASCPEGYNVEIIKYGRLRPDGDHFFLRVLFKKP